MTMTPARTVRIAASIGTAALAVATAFAVPAAAASHQTARPGSAVFVQTNSPAGNAIVAYDRDADGTLTAAGRYPTGGLGGSLAGSAVDHLASQGSLAYDRAHQLLYAVNAGSDTITVFAVHGDRLTRTQQVASGGSFPVGIAVHGDRVYVLNALDGGSVQGFVRVGDSLATVHSWNRGLGLDPTATPQFTHTPGQIAFTPDGTRLVVTTKAATNSIDVFPLDRSGTPARTPVVNSEPGTVPFGFVFDAAGRLQVTQAGTNAVATYTVARDGKATPVGSPAATGQAATCWIVRDGRHLYASNAGSDSLSGFRTGGRHGLVPLGDTGTDGGTVDAAVSSDGRYLYAQTGAKGIVDEFRVNHDGSLTAIGSVTVPDAVGGEGIVAR
ncbi:beta-propeller fold lactonase family protein [Streptomyces sp. NPDC002763]|uniref:lactonase family protein n=1 Tax=Streptomyces sp. NPDC002763 TaxID=3154427 RepID=UPI003331852E